MQGCSMGFRATEGKQAAAAQQSSIHQQKEGQDYYSVLCVVLAVCWGGVGKF